jgi:hypothetical protein
MKPYCSSGLDHPFIFFSGRPTRARVPLAPLLSLSLPLPPGPGCLGTPLSETETRRSCAPHPVRNRSERGRGAARRSGPGPTPPPRRVAPHGWRPHSSPFFPPPRLEKLPSALLPFSTSATVSPRFSTPVSYPVLRWACSAGSTHQDLDPSPKFGPPPSLSASRVGKPCLVEFLSNLSRPHPLFSLSEL